MQIPASFRIGAAAGDRPVGLLRLLTAVALLATLSLSGCTDLMPASAGEAPRVSVHIIDVGQGDAILIDTSQQRVLMDAGDWWGGGEVVQYLRAQGVAELDAAIVTHPAPGHSGGMEQVLNRIAVSRYYDAGALGGGSTYRNLLGTVASLQIPYTRLRAGDELELGGGAVIEVLAPFDELQQEAILDEDPDPALVTRLRVGAVSFLLTSQLGERGEGRLLRVYGEELDATVLKVANHGDRRVTRPGFLSAVQPSVAVITAGVYNEFGHPHSPVLERLEEASVGVLRTDRHGNVLFRTDGRQLVWTTEFETPE